MYIFLAIMLGLLVPYGIRVAIGPSVWDRLLGMNLIASKIIIIIMLFASINQSAFLLDFAIIYALSGFIGTIFIALFLSERDRKKNPKED
jgi:multicomponent Na+:H+ antiporter subunit F